MWGWRVAFWLSAVVVLIGYYVRTKITDAPIFLAAQQQADQETATGFSAVEVLKRYPRGVFTAMGLHFRENIMCYLGGRLLLHLPQGARRGEYHGDLGVAAGRAHRALTGWLALSNADLARS